jgi:ATP-dependent Zn protease
MARACEVVDANRDQIARLVEGLMERDTLEAEEIRHCFNIEETAHAA